MDLSDKTTAIRGWHSPGSTGTQVCDDDADTAKDIKGYLSGLGKNRLILLASKYKVKICRTHKKSQIIETFLCRVPSDMIEPICTELEREEQHRLIAPMLMLMRKQLPSQHD
jgi:hypothetical protein